jgi:hypothetical protein
MIMFVLMPLESGLVGINLHGAQAGIMYIEYDSMESWFEH